MKKEQKVVLGVAAAVAVIAIAIALKKPVPTAFHWTDYDFNGNGIIDPNEMDAAIEDQRAGIITYEQLKEVGAHRGPPV